ncbi:DNA topoisomerase VI subunit A [Candidatus Haloredivivus sp. G17]|nr:DNA topoisomerase VI subunit A [Candidatus Haloredivivus sp. G17]
MINMMHNELELPVYVFTDGDPWGYYIYSVLKSGSMSLAFQSDRLATPDAKLIGMTMEDIEEYGLEHVTEDLKGKPRGLRRPNKGLQTYSRRNGLRMDAEKGMAETA